MLQTQKNQFRKQIKTLLKEISIIELNRKSSDACANVINLPEFQQSSNISVYLAMPQGELNPDQLIQSSFSGSRRVFVPKVTGSEPENMIMCEMLSYSTIESLPKGKWNIPEPPLPNLEEYIQEPIDTIIVPGVAFDSCCNRLGHGKGYYDNFITRMTLLAKELGRPPPVTIGLFLDEQQVESVPSESHDQILDIIVTPTQIFRRN